MTPSTDWKEQIPPGENERFEVLAEQLRQLHVRASGGSKTRTLHNKATAGVEGTFTVLPDLPEHARVGLFAEPASYKAYVRFSNGAPMPQSDKKPDVRALAMKIVGVSGKKVIPGMEDAKTQDILLNRSEFIPFKNPEEFVGLVVGAASPPLGLLKFIMRFGLGRLITLGKTMSAGLGLPISSLATTRFFSEAPIQFGKYAARLRVVPHAKLDGAEKTPDSLGDELANRLRNGAVSYDLQAQFFVDETRTPIEDPSVNWTEDVAPYVTIGRLELAQQDASSERGRELAAWIETLSFDPWHARVEHKPLGAIMRARNVAYRVSVIGRDAAKEPDGSEKFAQVSPSAA